MTFINEHIRSYERGNEKEILELFELVFGKKMSLDFWNWRFRDNPWANGIITLAWDKDVLASHYAVMPIHIQVKDALIKAVFSMTTMTNPEYRGKSLFPKLAKRTYETSKELGYKLVYGFPNAISHRGFVKKLKWFDLGNVPIYSLNTSNISKMQNHKNPYIVSEKIKSFSDSLNELWEVTRTKFTIAVPRNKTFLNWRFAKHPEIEYFMFLLRNEEEELVGYYVLKIFEFNGQKNGHIVDYLLLDGDLFRELLVYAGSFFMNQGIHNLSFWMNQDLFNNLTSEIQKSIKRFLMPGIFFGHSLFERFENSNLFRNFDNYYITMADSDVF
jgi:hypothetical protein